MRSRSRFASFASFFTALAAFLIASAALGPPAAAQAGPWRAYPALREVTALDASTDAVWAATTGGVFAYLVGTGEVQRYSPVEGLFGVDVRTLAVDAVRGAVWIGYEAGALDRLDAVTGAVETFYDIQRAEQYPTRRVNRVVVQGDSLLVATTFGLVVFDAARGEVRDTYARLGPLAQATPVYDALVAPLPPQDPQAGRAGLWLATEGGVVRAPLADPDLREPSAWTQDAGAPAPARHLAFYDGRVVAGGTADAYLRGADGAWEPAFFGPINDLGVFGGRLFAVVPGAIVERAPGQPDARYAVTGFGDPRALTGGPGGAVWLGDGRSGLARLPDARAGAVVEPAETVVPEGPLSNIVAELAVGPDGTLWLVHSTPVGISRLTTDGDWTVFTPEGGLDLARAPFRSAHVAADGTLWAGSDGDGLTMIVPDGVGGVTATTFREGNSSLRAATGAPGFVIAPDAMTDADGRLWVLNRANGLPLHVRDLDGTWTALFPLPAGFEASSTPLKLYIDAFDQKWLTLNSRSALASGRGVAVVVTGATPGDTSDDLALTFTSGTEPGFGLSDDLAQALAEDGEGRMWIGTDRGVAVIATPGSAPAGDASLLQPQWPLTEDGTSYFLRDADVTDLARDPAGQLWAATTTGAVLINGAGSGLLDELTAENSPLFSNNVVAVAVDPASGRVYLATDRGVLSYDAEATTPSPTAEALRVYPAPFRPAEHADGVVISGLVAETDIRVLTLDGRVVASLTGRGGTARWDGRDERTGELVGSGVYLVAARGADGEGTAYGKVAVIR